MTNEFQDLLENASAKLRTFLQFVGLNLVEKYNRQLTTLLDYEQIISSSIENILQDTTVNTSNNNDDVSTDINSRDSIVPLVRSPATLEIEEDSQSQNFLNKSIDFIIEGLPIWLLFVACFLIMYAIMNFFKYYFSQIERCPDSKNPFWDVQK